ncbi:1,4-beta-glucanase [Streptomyces avermitilis]|uniref:Secreted endo-1,4-beta-glucanase n=2 Tax=Streptomyces avermitilis TaxID=33903 RepID=Q82K30_STRAW|nr:MULTISPECIES: sialidase family protein [Streptomyces]KUN50038.1 1,4-beta-glucanase [Streptomyces avermitilis]MYS98180.1 1,4-beta-glucanase [Streptomyces sp. SID5469]OOV33402.1 1,4-beta-glucanase [Streptomyces avermitilis]BAC70285.1 putative secreted endo-1,4-beta-glucanase [Streptomyces avermitilis MA-4680 = NBRC 14893]BBJ50377.1 carbohydrate-binding protein [Streptomyces avermitilis]
MRTPRPSRRTVLAGTAAAAALTAVPAVGSQAHAAETTAGPSYRWRNAVIGGTGFVTGVLFHPSVRGLAYARTDIGGAYRWDDRGARWTPLIDHLGWDDWNLLGVEAMAVDPTHPDRLYLAVGTYAQSWAGNGAVLRSEDRGATWTRTDLTVKLGGNEDGRGAGERLLVDPRDSDTLWLGTRHDGLLKSTDRGATWAAATAFPAKANSSGQGVVFLVAAGRTVYAGWGDGDGTSGTANLYRTADGTTWGAVPGRPSGTSAKVPLRAAYDTHTRELYVTYGDAPGPGGQSDGSVHKLRTATGTWTEVTPVKPGGTTSDGSADTFAYGGVAVDARRPGTLVVSTNNRWADGDTVFRSTDGGRTWTSLKDAAVFDVSETPFLDWGDDKPKFGWWIQALAVDPYDSQHVVYGTGATLYGTRDLKRWAPRIRGLEESAVRQLISPPVGEAHLISGLGDIGVMYHERLTASPSRGMATNPVFGSATGLAQAAARPAYVVRTGWGDHGNGAYSHDGGRTWAPFEAQPDIAKDAPGPIATSADGGTLLWSFVHWDGTTYAAHRSTDNGASWSEVSSFPKGATPVADPADPTRFYAYDFDNGTLYASTDSGRSFTARAGGLPSGDSQFKLVAAPGRSGDLWLSAKWNGLYRSTDGGDTFARIDSCWASYTLGFGKAADGADYPAIYQVGSTETITAVYRSDDAARTWVRINDDAHQWGWIGEAVVGDPRIHGRVYLATNGRGIQYGEPV